MRIVAGKDGRQGLLLSFSVMRMMAPGCLLLKSFAGATCGPTLPELPADIAQAKVDLITLAQDNQSKWGDETINAQVQVLMTTLENWYIDNRPANEVETSKGGWLALWLLNPFFVFDIPFLFSTDRDNTYQVVIDGNIFNVVRYDFIILFFFRFSITVIIQEEAELIDLATPETCGQTERNVLLFGSLETPCKILWRWLSSGDRLIDVVDQVKSGELETTQFAAPNDITGLTDFVRYLDGNLRIVTHGSTDSVYVRQEVVP